MNTLRPSEWFPFRSLPILLAGSLALSGCAGDSQPKPTAACNGLKVTVIDKAKHEVEMMPTFSVANGAKYESTTYSFGPNLRPITVEAVKDPTGSVIYDYPAEPLSQDHEITATINYTGPDSSDVFGSTQQCSVNVRFRP